MLQATGRAPPADVKEIVMTLVTDQRTSDLKGIICYRVGSAKFAL